MSLWSGFSENEENSTVNFHSRTLRLLRTAVTASRNSRRFSPSPHPGYSRFSESITHGTGPKPGKLVPDEARIEWRGTFQITENFPIGACSLRTVGKFIRLYRPPRTSVTSNNPNIPLVTHPTRCRECVQKLPAL